MLTGHTDNRRELPSHPPAAFEYRFAPSTAAIRLARYALADWLAVQHHPSDDAVDDLLIACSELCTNAVLHAATGGDIVVRGSVDGDAVVLEVEDGGAGMAWPRTGSIADVVDDEEHGRGLFIVAALTDDLSMASDGPKTVVTCRREAVLSRPATADHGLSERFRAHPPPTA
ncbi:MAG TPA: ATP-binding protein [Acidimicrobiales bacterium]|nr:ATP-binding protein [Acidimicrobiales bacterium]